MHAETMLLAYDPTGVTAAFNLNLLARMNRELEGDSVLRQFKHEVRYQEVVLRQCQIVRPSQSICPFDTLSREQ